MTVKIHLHKQDKTLAGGKAVIAFQNRFKEKNVQKSDPSLSSRLPLPDWDCDGAAELLLALAETLMTSPMCRLPTSVPMWICCGPVDATFLFTRPTPLGAARLCALTTRPPSSSGNMRILNKETVYKAESRKIATKVI